ncbi:MAG: zf-HC2 domain-containing protein [Candidatus Zixiibacteriota bacterium]
MLSRQLTLLIEAYVDGDLTPDKRAEAEKVLAESEECRQYHRQMVVLRNLLKSSTPKDPGEDYWQESADLIFAKTSNREPVYVPGKETPQPVSTGFRRAVYSAVVSLSVLITALSLGSKQPVNYAVVRMDNSEYLAATDVREKLSITDEMNAQVETARLAGSSILIGSPGSVGRAAQPPMLTLAY